MYATARHTRLEWSIETHHGMRVLQLVQTPQRRGAEIFAVQLAAELRRRGHRARVAALYAPTEADGLDLGPEGLHLGGRHRHPLERVPGFHPGLARRLGSEIRRFHPHVVQANGARTVKYAALASLTDRRRDWVLVYRNIGDPREWVRGLPRRLLYRHLVAPRLDAVAGVSRITLEAVEHFYPRLHALTEHIPSAVDPAALVPAADRTTVRRRLATPADAPVLLFVGRLAREKRPDRLLRLTARLAVTRPALHLWIAGTGPLTGEVHEQVERLGLAGRVRLLGAVDGLADLYRAADLLVSTSDTEGMPAVILEAAYLGLPAVASDVGGISETVLDGDTGLLIAAGDESALLEGVDRLLEDPERRREMGERARLRARRDFTIGSVACRYEELYRRSLERQGHREVS